MRLIAAAAGKPNFDALSVDVGHGVVLYGRFLTSVANFLLIDLTLFVVVGLVDRIGRLRHGAPAPELSLPEQEVVLLGEIRDFLARPGPVDGRTGGRQPSSAPRP